MPLKQLTSPTHAVTSAERDALTSTTPTSFDLIPPLLSASIPATSATLTPAPSPWPSTTTNIQIIAMADALELWDAAESRGLGIPWDMVSLHALSKGEAGVPCLYCQIDEVPGKDEEEQEGQEEGENTRELVIVPADPSQLERLFDAFSECAAAFPSAVSDMEDDDAGGAMFSGEVGAEEGMEDLSEVGRATMAHLDSIIDWPSVPTLPTNGIDGHGVNGHAVEDVDDEGEEASEAK